MQRIGCRGRVRLVARRDRARAGERRRRILPRVVRPDAATARAARRPLQPEIPRGSPLHSLVIIPLLARGRTIGVISLGTTSAGRTIDADLVAVASDVAQPRRHRARQCAAVSEDPRAGPAQERVSRDALARAAQSARADHQRRSRHADQRRRREKARLGARSDRPPGQAALAGWSTTCSTCRGSRRTRSSSRSNRSTSPQSSRSRSRPCGR